MQERRKDNRPTSMSPTKNPRQTGIFLWWQDGCKYGRKTLARHFDSTMKRKRGNQKADESRTQKRSGEKASTEYEKSRSQFHGSADGLPQFQQPGIKSKKYQPETYQDLEREHCSNHGRTHRHRRAFSPSRQTYFERYRNDAQPQNVQTHDRRTYTRPTQPPAHHRKEGPQTQHEKKTQIQPVASRKDQEPGKYTNDHQTQE